MNVGVTSVVVAAYDFIVYICVQYLCMHPMSVPELICFTSHMRACMHTHIQHFDSNLLTLTFMVQKSEGGGLLEVHPLIGRENYDSISDVLDGKVQ